MKRQHLPIGMLVVGVLAIISGGLAGCDLFGGGGGTSLPKEIVMWGDPDPESDAMFATVRDVNNEDDRFVVIGTDGKVQFSVGKVCNVCTVEGSTILVDGGRINIRFGPGLNGTGERRPFLVNDEGYYIQLVTKADTVVFVAETVVFEEPDNPDDDLAVRVGSFPNPALAG